MHQVTARAGQPAPTATTTATWPAAPAPRGAPPRAARRAALLAIFLAACGSEPREPRTPAPVLAPPGVRTRPVLPRKATRPATQSTTGGGRTRVLRGLASWYGKELQGRKTASGERFDRHKLTAAHRKLPFGTRVRVTNTRNGKSVIVRINDRGPFGGKRIIDLSEAAARRIGMIGAGVATVTVEVLR